AVRPQAQPTVFPLQFPVCWRRPVRRLNIVLLPTFGFPARATAAAPPSSLPAAKPAEPYVSPIIYPPTGRGAACAAPHPLILTSRARHRTGAGRSAPRPPSTHPYRGPAAA